MWTVSDWIRPLRVSSRSCSALARATRASSKDSRLVSMSDLGRTPLFESSCDRSNSARARSKEAFAESTRRSTSVISCGVGSGAISNSGSPGRTLSPTLTMQRFTMPEIFDLIENFWRGWIWPTASAFSVIEPFSTVTSLRSPSSPLPPRARA